MNDDLNSGSFNVCYGDGTSKALTMPLNLCLCSESPGWKGITAYHFKQADLKAIRGLPVKASRVLNFRVAGIGADGRFLDTGTDLFLVSSGDRLWTMVNVHGVITTGSQEYLNDNNWDKKVGVAYGFQCFDEYCWHANLQFEKNSPAISLVADDELLEAVLKMRDIPPGKSKRDRVLHMVNAHNRAANNGQVSVNKHLRGHIEHLWQGCNLQIFPPVNDLAKLKETPKVNQVKNALELVSSSD